MIVSSLRSPSYVIRVIYISRTTSTNMKKKKHPLWIHDDPWNNINEKMGIDMCVVCTPGVRCIVIVLFNNSAENLNKII